jgi:hypothetical protein
VRCGHRSREDELIDAKAAKRKRVGGSIWKAASTLGMVLYGLALAAFYVGFLIVYGAIQAGVPPFQATRQRLTS